VPRVGAAYGHHVSRLYCATPASCQRPRGRDSRVLSAGGCDPSRGRVTGHGCDHVAKALARQIGGT